MSVRSSQPARRFRHRVPKARTQAYLPLIVKDSRFPAARPQTFESCIEAYCVPVLAKKQPVRLGAISYLPLFVEGNVALSCIVISERTRSEVLFNCTDKHFLHSSCTTPSTALRTLTRVNSK